MTAVRGLGERLVSGEAVGDEWTVHADRIEQRRSEENAIDDAQVRAVAELANRVAAQAGRPQDIEWATAGDRLVLLQARPMTALPSPVDWTPPGPGLWMRNFRLGEWLPEAMTPLFADWLLPRIEDGYLAGMRGTVGTTVAFRYAAINGWYYNALPMPSPGPLARALLESRGRLVPVVANALIRVSRNPVAADRAILDGMYRQWRDELLPRYRKLVIDADAALDHADPPRLCAIVDRIGHTVGEYLWYLSIVGGSAWKIEARLTRFCRDHLDTVTHGNAQVLLRGLPGTEPGLPPHAVHSLDWYHPTAGELAGDGGTGPGLETPDRHEQLGHDRRATETACRDVLAANPKLLRRFDVLLEVAQRYAVIREEQARDLTLGWPLLRRCAHRLGGADHLGLGEAAGHVDD
ncbi:MAG: hypothetical protein GEV09_25675, partial [Pseudonocardiaceae bacterium]|nr:hypothetical protein [Pseudonocardiaceae bacterium]